MQTDRRPSLVDEVRSFLDVATMAAGGGAAGIALRALSDRLDGPLRVAVAGRAGTGKSTIVNALVGAEVAPSRESDRAGLLAWYRGGTTPRIVLQRHDDDPLELRTLSDGHTLDVDLPAVSAGDTLLVEWPSPLLRDVTLVDLPGSAAAAPTSADALLYVMTNLSVEDIDHLEAFHRGDLHHPLAVNAIGVLSRVDDLGVSRPDAVAYARRVAASITAQPTVRRLCQRVVPVAGLVAHAATQLGADDVDALRRLAAAPSIEVDAALDSRERFVRVDLPGLPTVAERQWLLFRLGLFGVRLAVGVLRTRPAATAHHLAAGLRTMSGIDDLLRAVDAQLIARAPLLRARSVLRDAKTILLSHPPAGGVWLLASLERIEAAAHELNELRVLHALQSGLVQLRLDDALEGARLLGSDGPAPHARLGLDDEADPARLRDAAQVALRRWQRLAVDPVITPLEVHAAATVVRSCEGLLEGLT